MVSWLLAASLAQAAPVEVASTRPIVLSEPAEILVALETGSLDGISVSAGRVAGPASLVSPGVWKIPFDPPAVPGKVLVTVSRRDHDPSVHPLTVQAIEASGLKGASRVDGVVGDQPVQLRVRSDEPLHRERFLVAASEGQVQELREEDGALVATLLPEDSRFARYVPVLLHDGVSSRAPHWVDVRLRARPVVAIQSEPGATMTLHIGDRTYGPVTADAEGILRVTVDHYPGELNATALIRDEVGNELSTPLPLPSNPGASMAILATGDIFPGQSPPGVYVRALHGNGAPWSGRAPGCRTSGLGELAMVTIDEGVWRAQLPRMVGEQLRDVDIYCSIRGVTEAHVRVRLAREIASALHLDVFPSELSADFPVAEVQAYLEDPQGGRMPTGGVQLAAQHGVLTLEPASGVVLRATYRGGRSALDAGQDRITARLVRPTSEGPVASLHLLWGGLDTGGAPLALAQVLDHRGAPVGGVTVTLDAGGDPVTAVSDASGWVRATVARPSQDSGAVHLRATAGGHTQSLLSLPSTPAHLGTPSPEIEATRELRITTGRVSSVELEVDPPLLYLTPGAVAFVRVRLLDRFGRPVDDIPVLLDASDGTIGAPVLQGDGTTWLAEYTPILGERPRRISISARPVEGEASAEAQLALTPRPIERSVAVVGGGITNFGAVSGGLFGVDIEGYTSLSSAVQLRLGIANTGNHYEAATGIGGPQTVEYLLFPLTLGVTRRLEQSSGAALWGGGGAVLAPYRKIIRFGQPVAAGWGLFPPGLAAWGGYGWRVGSAELGFEARYLFLQGSPGASGLEGQVGGLAGVGTVRVLF